MNVKNIKSFIEFYESLGVSTFLTQLERSSISHKSLKIEKIKEKSSNDKHFLDDKAAKLSILKKKIEQTECGLKDIASNLVFSDGNYNAKIMLIGEAPGAEEDKDGKPFVGEAGKLLDKMLDCIFLKRSKNFYITNIIFWRPPGNRIPNNQEINICLPFVKEHINIINPQLIIPLGNIAARSLLNTDQGITKIRGKNFFYVDYENNLKIETIPIFHPAYLLRNPIEKKYMWEDLKKIYKFTKERKIL
ncbi:MAG: uracil-DNA glycosylase [Pseudomonadota bacterium]|nr:uracil-DNA glycosylase [Pseudomonadota bacterium]